MSFAESLPRRMPRRFVRHHMPIALATVVAPFLIYSVVASRIHELRTEVERALRHLFKRQAPHRGTTMAKASTDQLLRRRTSPDSESRLPNALDPIIRRARG